MTTLRFEIGSRSAEYVLALTDAPPSYDFHGTFTLIQFDYPLDTEDFRTKGNARLVAIPQGTLQPQIDRNCSGRHPTFTDKVEEYWPAAEVAGMLWNKLTA